MKDDFIVEQRALEQATATGDLPAERLDAETASLREAWLALGEILEAAQPPNSVSPLALEEGPGVRVVAPRTRLRWSRLLAAGALAAALLLAVAAIWTLGSSRPQDNSDKVPKPMVANNHQGARSPGAIAKGGATADLPRWDDSFDEQYEQLSWQMLCAQENQVFRTDAFGRAQYRLEQLRETIQADSL
jgi:hypothetical protein